MPKAATTPVLSSHECYGYNKCSGTQCSDYVIKCDEPEHADKRSHCYAFWTSNSGVVAIQSKGCWLDHLSCYGQTECTEIEQKYVKEKYQLFCCCEGNLCNGDVHARSYDPEDETQEPRTTTGNCAITNTISNAC